MDRETILRRYKDGLGILKNVDDAVVFCVHVCLQDKTDELIKIIEDTDKDRQNQEDPCFCQYHKEQILNKLKGAE